MEAEVKKFSFAAVSLKLRLFKRSLGLAYQAAPVSFIGSVFCVFAAAFLPLIMLAISQQLIDSIIAKSVEQATFYVLVEGALLVAQALLLRAQFYFRAVISARLVSNCNLLMLGKISEHPYADLENPEIYNKFSQAWRDSSSRPIQLLNEMSSLVQSGLLLSGVIGMMIGLNAWIVVGLLLAAVPSALVEMRFSDVTFRLQNMRSPDRRRLAYYEFLLGNDRHAKEMRVLRLSDYFLVEYRRLVDLFFKEDRVLLQRRSFWAFALSLLSVAVIFSIYYWLMRSALAGVLTVGGMTFYFMAFRSGQGAFDSILRSGASLYEQRLYLQNFFGFLDEGPPALKNAGTFLQAPLQNGIFFDNVGFRYPGRDTWALRNLSLQIEPGQTVALVGSNGAGKSTLIKLLCGLYEPTEGTIWLDGKPLQNWDKEILYRRFAVLFQDFNCYQMKFRENVGFGHLEKMQDAEKIKETALTSGAQDVLDILKQGLETQLGRWFEGGTELSGGQWQKIALARTFFHSEADLFILDEPTSALDAEAEHDLLNKISKLRLNKIGLIVSHRFSTVRLATKIFVLEEGRVLEQGRHEELLKNAGTYARLYNLQASGYQ